jgi:hypothetical protein
MFEHVVEFRGVIRALLGSNAEAVVRRHIHSILVAVIDHEVKMELQKGNRGNCPISPEFLTHFLVSTFISVLIWWLNSRNPVSPKQIDAAYRDLVLPCLASIFG